MRNERGTQNSYNEAQDRELHEMFLRGAHRLKGGTRIDRRRYQPIDYSSWGFNPLVHRESHLRRNIALGVGAIVLAVLAATATCEATRHANTNIATPTPTEDSNSQTFIPHSQITLFEAIS